MTSPPTSSASVERLERDLARLVDKGKMEDSARGELLSRIRTSTDLRDMAKADIIVEAIFEDLDAKKQLFARLDEVCREGVVLGSNSSSLSILDMAMATKRPESVVGIHFFNPVPLMKGVELVCTIMTSFQTLEAARQFSVSLGKDTWWRRTPRDSSAPGCSSRICLTRCGCMRAASPRRRT